MPKNKPAADLSKAVAESPISDVFEGRDPAASEKEWAEKTLAPTLDKAPEKPIGASTGTNLDEHGHARFSTISNTPIRRLYTQADLPADWNYDTYLGYPGQPPYTRGIHSTGYRGKLWTMRMFSGFASPEETNATSICSNTAGADSRSPSTCRRSWDTTPITQPAKAKSANAESPSTRSKIWRFSSTASASKTSPLR
jgi:hypothetical protein